MTDSQFWRDMEGRFRALPDPFGMLRADWSCSSPIVDGKPAEAGVEEWRLCGGADRSLIIRFEALARQAGAALGDPRVSDPMSHWLDALKREGRNFQFRSTGWAVDKDGVERERVLSGTIERVCEASADFCLVLEAAAFQREQRIPPAPVDLEPPGNSKIAEISQRESLPSSVRADIVRKHARRKSDLHNPEVVRKLAEELDARHIPVPQQRRKDGCLVPRTGSWSDLLSKPTNTSKKLLEILKRDLSPRKRKQPQQGQL